MDPIQDNAAAQASAASLEAAAEPGTSTSFHPGTDENDEVEIVCIRAIQSRELGVIVEPGERRIIPYSKLEAFLLTEAFQMLGPVVRSQSPPPVPSEPVEDAKPARRKKAE